MFRIPNVFHGSGSGSRSELSLFKNVKTKNNFAKFSKADAKITVKFSNLFFKRPLKCKILNFF